MDELMVLDGLLDLKDFPKLIFRMAMNLTFIAVLIRGVYLRLYQRRDFAFTCVLLNVVTFSVCLLLRKVPVELGFALGLFAVFGILRFRTEAIGTRELTYLFVAIGLGMVNAVANKKVSLAELLFIDGFIVGLTAWLEYAPFGDRKDSRLILYDNLELLKPGRSAELVEDLRRRTGMEVTGYRVNDIDLLRDSAQITVSCLERRNDWAKGKGTPPPAPRETENDKGKTES
jgi:hypothetical protein